MSSQNDSVQPPRIAGWLVSLFTNAEEAEAVRGDLLEEFWQVAARRAGAGARRWYWRQSLKTIAHLFGMGFRLAPWSTAGAVIAGYVLRGFVYRWQREAIEAVLERYRLYESHPDLYLFWLTSGREMGEIVSALLIGMLVGALAKGREMTATVTLALAHASLVVFATVWVLASGRHFFWEMLPVYFAFSLATVAGGAIVRLRRSQHPRPQAG